MKIVSWNVNGIRAILKKGNLQEFLATENPDIICLQETKADDSTMKGIAGELEEKLGGYKIYWNSAEKKGYSGTAIFSKYEPIRILRNFSDEYTKKYNFTDKYGDTNTEGRILVLEFKNFILSTVYTPNAKEDLTRLPMRHKNWDVAFLEYMNDLEKDLKKPVIFCGDLNVAYTENDLARPKENLGKKGFTDEERAGFGKYLESNFVDTWRMFVEGNGVYTWWSNLGGARSRNVGWRIDYILVSKKLETLVKSAHIHDQILGSDHCPVAIEIDL
jgi:exodeoxyribonuclease-3